MNILRNKLAVIIAFIAVVVGLTAIIKVVSAIDTELTVGLISLTFGLTAIMWTLKARKSLSKGSSLRKYTESFAVCVFFLLAFSIWRTLEHVFQWEYTLGNWAVYPEYFFITMAYIGFVMAGYKILYLGKEFGFEGESKKIKELIRRKKNKKANKLYA